MDKRLIVAALVLVLIVGAAAYYKMKGDTKKGGISMIEEAAMAKDFTLPDIKGDLVSLSSLKGKVVFLNFWATWCPPCRAEMPSIQRLHEKMEGKDFVILAVDIGEQKRGVESFIERNKLTFTVLLDSEHKVSNDYQVAGIPTTLLIDKEGKIVLRETGSRDWSAPDIIDKIDKLLK